MSAGLDTTAPASTAAGTDQYVVAHGKGGGLGVFAAGDELALTRGDRVVVRTARGLELGTVLGPATLRQAQRIGALAAGVIVRRATPRDAAEQQELARRADELFLACQALVGRRGLRLAVFDVELLLGGQTAIVYFAGVEADVPRLAESLAGHADLQWYFECATGGVASGERQRGGDHGCGKPDCGRGSAAGCVACGSGGGCGTCGAGAVDLRAYFAHLRSHMETNQRTSLV
ncbi:MAG: PSP1 domain-containing protein [Gemmataceae bacterium]|nr:PSP1 domain-containing protein [Gemmataceae bacterium]